MATLKIPNPHIVSTFAPDTANEENRTVDIVFYSGAAVPRFSWSRGEYMLTLSTNPAHVRMGRLNSGRAPILDAHNDWSSDDVLGVVESGRIEKGMGLATARFAKDDERANRAWNKVQQKILQNVSMGVLIYKLQETSGTEDQAKEFLAIDWEPTEISLVPVGADPQARIKMSAHETLQEVELLSAVVPAPAAARGVPVSTLLRQIEALRLR